MRRLLTALICATPLATPRAVLAQKVSIDAIVSTDTTLRHEVRLHDGSRFVGRVTAVSADSVRISLQASDIAVPRTAIREVHQFRSSSLRNGERWADNSNPTRLLFSSTAYSLRRGEGYYWNAWLFFHGVAVGITDRLTFGGGFSLFPGADIGDNLFYVTPKLTVASNERGQLAVGALAAYLPDDEEQDASLGILYGVGSLGSRESNVSMGLGWGYADGVIADRPVLMLGGLKRATRRMSLITENWFFPEDIGGVLSYGFRFFGDRLSVDLAFVNWTEEVIFPGLPWVGFAVKF